MPWFNGDIVRARKRRGAAEKKWKRRKTSENWANYKSERNNVNYLIKRAKIDYYKRKIHEAGTDMRKLYFFLNTLVGGKNKNYYQKMLVTRGWQTTFQHSLKTKSLIYLHI